MQWLLGGFAPSSYLLGAHADCSVHRKNYRTSSRHGKKRVHGLHSTGHLAPTLCMLAPQAEHQESLRSTRDALADVEQRAEELSRQLRSAQAARDDAELRAQAMQQVGVGGQGWEEQWLGEQTCSSAHEMSCTTHRTCPGTRTPAM